ncbi:hypothetical protein GQ44DRAFT_632288 [Phaeosphaeriaceae sp. PMI808]|nr:hypothetical protein GQ44DRAFT_632288 [Phaeosphaeriaceae sp. PMI808]
MFGTLKKKLSRKGSNPLSESIGSTLPSTLGSWDGGLAPPQTNHANPFAASSPATRRPDRANMNPFGSTSEAPPTYSPGPARHTNTGPAQTAPVSTDDDPYAFLSSFDTVFLIDDSGSMAGRNWRETGKALEAITPICTQRDTDGIDIYFLNCPDSSAYKNITSEEAVVDIFQSIRPGGATPTGQRLNKILRPYLQRCESNLESTKPINIIVITDGEPSDDVESPIIQAAKKLDRLDAPAWQVGIQFFQVGKEPSARKHLKQLDDGLRDLAGDENLRDIVDTVPFMGEEQSELTAHGILKVVLGAVHKKWDRTSKELHR